MKRYGISFISQEVFEYAGGAYYLVTEVDAEIAALQAENTRLASEWQQTHDWNNKLVTEHYILKARIKELERALTSIANNSCCDGCQEAARVAKQALKEKP